MGADKVKHAFFAHYLCALIMCRLHDLKGLQLVRDHAHKHLTSFDSSMSDTAFWGRALFNPHDPLVRKLLAYGHASQLTDEAGRILTSRVHKIMDVLHQDPTLINWDEVIAVLYIMRHRFNLKSSYFEHITHSLKNWASLGDSKRRKTVSDCFMYLLQSDPESNLISHMRDLAGKTMLNDLKGLAMKVIAIRKLGECRLTLNENGEVVSTAGIATGDRMIFGNRMVKRSLDTPVTTQDTLDIAQSTARKARTNWSIKKRKRRFKAIKFRAPAHMKDNT
jgi:hypothetical protein